MKREGKPVSAPVQRFTLDTAAAVKWIDTLINLGDNDLPGEYDSPTGFEIHISADWQAMGAERIRKESSVQEIVLAAHELGILRTPENCEIVPSTNLSHWDLICDQYAGLVVTSAQDISLRTVDSYLSGAEAVLELLAEAVRVGNALFDKIEYAAPLIMAQTSADPVILTRLSDNSDPVIRSYASQNPACPDEGQVMAALRKKTNRN